MLRFGQKKKKIGANDAYTFNCTNFFVIKYRNSNLGQQVNEPDKHSFVHLYNFHIFS